MDTSTEEPIPSTSSKTPSTITGHQQFHQQQNQSSSAADGGGSNIFQSAINKKHRVSADYYDIDSILATTAYVAATFDSGTPLGIFPLIGQKAPESISEKGHRTVMPAWLLSAEIENICQFTVPSAYNKVNREVIAAGAKSGKLEATRLVARQRQFYALGRFICSHVRDEQRPLIAEQLLDAFTQRIGPVIMRAVDINSKPRDLLDEEEKQIFQAIQKTEHRRQEWTRREHRPEDRPHSSQRQSVKRKFNGAF